AEVVRNDTVAQAPATCHRLERAPNKARREDDVLPSRDDAATLIPEQQIAAAVDRQTAWRRSDDLDDRFGSTLKPSRTRPVIERFPSSPTLTAVKIRRPTPATASFTSSPTANGRGESNRRTFHWYRGVVPDSTPSGTTKSTRLVPRNTMPVALCRPSWVSSPAQKIVMRRLTSRSSPTSARDPPFNVSQARRTGTRAGGNTCV